MRLSGSCPASAASAGLAHLEHGQHVVVLEQFEQTVQLVTELVDQNDAAVEQRLAGVEVVDDDSDGRPQRARPQTMKAAGNGGLR